MMTTTTQTLPVILCCSGNDPSGGAGIQADIQAALSMGCHPAPVITALTAQNTSGLADLRPVDVGLVIEQIRAVLDDMPVAAIKIGLLGSADVAHAIYTVIKELDKVPIVIDPVLATGTGDWRADDELVQVIKSLLLPLATIITPNAAEARLLAPEADNLNACAQALLELGCANVLITGADEKTPEVINLHYSNMRAFNQFKWPRIQGRFHGTGCTLAAAIAALLGQGCNAVNAIQEAQQYTWECIKNAYSVGKGRWLPNRLYWAAKPEHH